MRQGGNQLELGPVQRTAAGILKILLDVIGKGQPVNDEKDLNPSRRSTFRRLAMGQREITAANSAACLDDAWDGYLASPLGTARLKKLKTQIGSYDKSALPTTCQSLPAEDSKAAWTQWFRELGEACEHERESAKEGDPIPTSVQEPTPVLPPQLLPYLRCQDDLHRRVRLPGLSEKAGEALGLLQIYSELQTQTVKPASRPNRPKSGKPDHPEDQPPLPVVAAARAKRLVLLGDPGSGKTTSLRYLCLVMSKGLASQAPTSPERAVLKQHDWTPEEASRVPIFIELREFTGESESGTAIIPAPPMVNRRRGALSSKSTYEIARKKWLDGATPQWLVDEVLRRFAANASSQIPDNAIREARTALTNLLMEGRCLVLFDGWDEVTDPEQRVFLRHAIEKLLNHSSYSRNAILLTCRSGVWNLGPGEPTQRVPWCLTDASPQREAWEVRKLLPLAETTWHPFLLRWLKAWRSVTSSDVDPTEIARRIHEHLSTSPNSGLRGIAESPLLLSLVAWLWAEEASRSQGSHQTTLVRTRAGLYQELTRKLLWELDAEKFATQAGPPVETLHDLAGECSDPENLERLIEALAWRATHRNRPAVKRQSLCRFLERLHQTGQGTDAAKTWAGKVIRTLAFRAGLLREEGPSSYVFMHATLREYLAARNVLTRPHPVFITTFESLIQDLGRYHEVLFFVAGQIAVDHTIDDSTHRRCGLNDLHTIIQPLLETEHPDENTILAAEIVADLSMGLKALPGGWVALLETAKRRCLAWIAGGQMRAKTRAIAGRALGYLGDPRPGVGLFPDSHAAAGVPNLNWNTIPAGPFFMGSKTGQALYEDEEPGGVYTGLVRMYRISRYTVTVQQYEAFVRDGGYRDGGTEEDTRRLLQWWTEAGLAWKREDSITGPASFKPEFQTPNHPRVGVSWYEAIAFCRWLTLKLRQIDNVKGGIDSNDIVTLPSEPEWERVARGGDPERPREYPWGSIKNEGDLNEHCNWHGSGVGHTSAVGVFPQGHAESGAADLAGNVWEWTRSVYQPYLYLPNTDRENLDAPAAKLRVLRGGSWILINPDHLRGACRFHYPPDIRRSNGGFRCVVVATDAAGR